MAGREHEGDLSKATGKILILVLLFGVVQGEKGGHFAISQVKMLQYLEGKGGNDTAFIGERKEQNNIYAFFEVTLRKSPKIVMNLVDFGLATKEGKCEDVLTNTTIQLIGNDTVKTVLSVVIQIKNDLIDLPGKTLNICARGVKGGKGSDKSEILDAGSKRTKWTLQGEVTLPPIDNYNLVPFPNEISEIEIASEESANQHFNETQVLISDGTGESNKHQDSLFASGNVVDVPEAKLRTRRAESGDGAEDLENVTNNDQPLVFAIKLETTSSSVSYTDTGGISVLDGKAVTLLLVGVNFGKLLNYKFTTSKGARGEECGQVDGHFKTGVFEATKLEEGIWKSEIPEKSLAFYDNQEDYYICIRNNATGLFEHQGESNNLKISIYKALLPFELMIVLVIVLLFLSGLFSGLNLGLMALDQTELRIVVNTGTDAEKSYAKAIMPIRKMGNFLLCSLLLGNVLVNNTLTIFLDTLTGGGGLIAVIGSTFCIVVFGEIIPQAVCSRHGLAVGARTIYLTKFFMFLTAPLSWPISKLLDKLLGSEIGTVYNRERLMELLKVTDEYNDLEKDEVDIMTGALVLKQKTVREVMTTLDDCFMLPFDSILDFETICTIKEQGYSRIPVFEGERGNIVHILFAKDLLFIDPEDNKPIAQVCEFYKNDVNIVFQDVKLSDMLNDFKSGDKGHMALVREVNNQGEGDPFYETIGLVTLEDIIEEIIQQEIIDETDIVIDNKTKKKRKRERYTKEAEFNLFIGVDKHFRVSITPQMNMAVFQYLTTSVPSFNPSLVSPHFLKKILSLDVYREVSVLKSKEPVKVMTKGKPCDYFILILEGKVQIQIGKEEHEFEAGPFTYYGKQVLEQALLIPPSPMVTSAAGPRGTTPSISMHSAVNQEAAPPPTLGPRQNSLRKTSTLVSLDPNSAKIDPPSLALSKRSGSADGSYAGSKSLAQAWIPDYTLIANTDLLYLEIRRKTYLGAVKATRMQAMHSHSGGFNDREIDSYLERVSEDDTDFMRTPSLRSPDRTLDGNAFNESGSNTPQMAMRRESMRNSLSMLKAKFLGGDRNSMDRSNGSKDEFWDGVAGVANHALDTEELSHQGNMLNAGSSGGSVNVINGPISLPLVKTANSSSKRELDLDSNVSEPNGKRFADNNRLNEVDGDKIASTSLEEGGVAVLGNNTTVISVRGNGGPKAEVMTPVEAQSTSPSDRTSLLRNDSPTS